MRRTVIIVIADHDLLRFSEFAHLAPEVFVEGVEVILQLARVHLVLRVVGGVLVEVGEEDGLAVGWFDVLARAAVAVAAGADFVVEGAVDFVLFGAEDGGEVVRHCASVCRVRWIREERKAASSSARWPRRLGDKGGKFVSSSVWRR